MSYTIYAPIPINFAIAKDLSRRLRYLCHLVICTLHLKLKGLSTHAFFGKRKALFKVHYF